jgi:AraC family transcriptional regulator of adaptative response/methylated-DNA-[protein]-cysteine methyltransferase
MNDDAKWTAVLDRDARSDGAFVYAVRTTGVYCRPSCPSRRPHRENVAFFGTADDAEGAAFRPCRRCRPRTSGNPTVLAVRRACAFLDAHLDEPVTLEALGTEVGLSPFHLQRTFKRETGVSPREYTRARRAERLKSGLQNGQTVTTALFDAGYGSGSRVYETADAELGMTPATYRAGGRGMHIRFALVGSPLGRLLVGATGRGLCAVKLGDDDRALEAGLRREYPRASFDRTDAGLAREVAALLALIDGQERGPAPSLPVDVQATAFQRRVWQALREIPSGSTRSYGEVATAIGRPSAARAVARACASNPVAVLVPCHRVIRDNGALGGYRWGIERKQRLLDAECAAQIPRQRRSATSTRKNSANSASADDAPPEAARAAVSRKRR